MELRGSRFLTAVAVVLALDACLAGCGKATTGGSSTRLPTPGPAPTVSLSSTAVATSSIAPPGETLGLFLAGAEGGQAREIWDGEVFFPRWSPNGRSIAVYASKDGIGGLYVLDVASGSSRYLGKFGGSVLLWSPDGSHLLAADPGGGPGSSTKHLVLVDVRSGASRALKADALFAQWAPDGRRVAISGTTCEDSQQRRVYDLGTDAITPLPPKYPVASTYISPDWSRIAYFKAPILYVDEAPVDATLYVAKFDGSGEQALFSPPAGTWPSQPAWSPDGRWVVYNTHDNGGVYLISVDRAQDPITLLARGHDGSADWGPDSTRLNLTVDTRIYVYDLRDGTRTPAPRGQYTASWSPDGERIFSLVDLSITHVTSGATATISVGPSVFVTQPQWSPDSTAIAFVSGRPIDGGPCI